MRANAKCHHVEYGEDKVSFGYEVALYGENGAIPVEAGGQRGRDKGSISVTLLLASCSGKRQLAQKMFCLHSPSGKVAGWQCVLLCGQMFTNLSHHGDSHSGFSKSPWLPHPERS